MIGLDGATFDLIHPWAAAGHLPTLASLVAGGAAGRLRSTVPPMSPPAWSSFLTGVNPGKHGIFDFMERKPGSYEVQFVSSRHRKAPTLAARLSGAGRRVCVIGVPTTYPVEPVNGVMISGFDAPTMNERAIHPAGLYRELRDKVGEYIITPNIMRQVEAGDTDGAVDALLRSIDRKADIARYLLQREPWDCFLVVFGETDKVVHHFWKHHDPRSPRYAPLPPGCRHPDPILAVYRHLDGVIRGLAEAAPGDSTLLVASDHGTGGTGDKIIYLNRWLASRGVLRFRGLHDGLLAGLGARANRFLAATVLGRARKWGTILLPAVVRKGLRYGRGNVAGQLESKLRFANIDWGATRAYSEESFNFPNVWINLRGREPSGIVEPGDEYEQLRERLIAELGAWRDPETGEPVVAGVWRREDLYRGPCTGAAPDLIIAWALDRGFTYLSRPSYTARDGRPIARLDPGETGISKFLLSRSGSHRDDGILILHGPAVRAGVTPADPRITDVAPTVLALLGLPVPADMDGRVLLEALR